MIRTPFGKHNTDSPAVSMHKRTLVRSQTTRWMLMGCWALRQRVCIYAAQGALLRCFFRIQTNFMLEALTIVSYIKIYDRKFLI